MKKEDIDARQILEDCFFDWAQDENNETTWDDLETIKRSPDSDFVVYQDVDRFGHTHFSVGHPMLNEDLSLED